MTAHYFAWAIQDVDGALYHGTHATRTQAIAAFVRNVDRDAYAAAEGCCVWDKLHHYRGPLSAADRRAWRKQRSLGRNAVRVQVVIAARETTQ